MKKQGLAGEVEKISQIQESKNNLWPTGFYFMELIK